MTCFRCFTGVHAIVWIVLFAAGLIAIDLRAAGGYGRVQYWLAMIKLMTIAAFIVLGTTLLLGRQIQPQYSYVFEGLRDWCRSEQHSLPTRRAISWLRRFVILRNSCSGRVRPSALKFRRHKLALDDGHVDMDLPVIAENCQLDFRADFQRGKGLLQLFHVIQLGSVQLGDDVASQQDRKSVV
jgi:hypothetical protein